MLLFVVAFCVGVTWVSSSSLDGVLQSEDVRYFIPYSSIRGASQSVTAVVDNHDQYGFKPFVRYWLEYDKPYSLVYANATGQCKIGLTHNKWGRKPILREGLDKSLSKILDVTTYLQTNLKIITVGDSVAMQFHQVLEEALEPPPKPRTIGDVGLGIGNQTTYRTLYQSAWEGHESVSVSAPVNGGGALAAFRMTGLLLTEGRGKPPPNAGPDLATAAGGWLPQHVQQILDHKYTAVVSGNDNGVASSTDSFDVMIFRIPHGWLPASLVTRERLEKSLSLARDLFGVRTVIIQTLTLNVSSESHKFRYIFAGTITFSRFVLFGIVSCICVEQCQNSGRLGRHAQSKSDDSRAGGSLMGKFGPSRPFADGFRSLD